MPNYPTAPRPADKPADITGAIVDAATGEILVCERGGPNPDSERNTKDRKGWLLRWRTAHRGQKLHYVRFTEPD